MPSLAGLALAADRATSPRVGAVFVGLVTVRVRLLALFGGACSVRPYRSTARRSLCPPCCEDRPAKGLSVLDERTTAFNHFVRRVLPCQTEPPKRPVPEGVLPDAGPR